MLQLFLFANAEAFLQQQGRLALLLLGDSMATEIQDKN